MVSFRKIRIGDLDAIYQNEHLRSLVTKPLKGEGFVIVIDEDGTILGGARGYVEKEAALLQLTAIVPFKDYLIYKDGMIRSLIHILELEGLKYLFIYENDDLYLRIGFQSFDQDEWKGTELGDLIKNDISGKKTLWIDLKNFFA